MSDSLLPNDWYSDDLEYDSVYTGYELNLDFVDLNYVTLTHDGQQYSIEIQDGQPVVVADE